MKNIVAVTVLFLIISCVKSKENKEVLVEESAISGVTIEVVLQDSTLNIRALEITEKGVVIATSNGQTLIKEPNSKEFKKMFETDTIRKPNFRALAYNGESIFTISIESPALLYKDGELVYTELHEKAFYDAMEFWNENEGIAIGDQTDGCMSIVITRDGGSTWKKLPCNISPKVTVGEGAFAASDTNIKIIGNHTWIATGGVASRILYSPNKGKSWQVYETPIVQGAESTGMYSVDFYDENIGFAIGGDYSAPEVNQQNKIKTIDGGKTWELVAKAQNPGYRSCVQFIPNSNGTALVAVGFNGIDYSKDFGSTWKHLSDKGFYTIRFLNDSIAYAAGKGRVSKLTFN
ncbi:MAG: oxidoreductase [Flavobacteriaceae bacterium]|nr:oxidoreductase [Flavobacteriaceae bacterium]